MTRFSDEQLSVIETFGRGMAVLAGAGSGKTTTLVAKCEELLKRQPEARIAAVSFTERSASDLRAKLSLTIGLSEGKHWVMTIHGLCGAVLREFPREAGFDGEESMLSEPESRALWEQALQALWADEVPDEIVDAMDRLLARETRASSLQLLTRVKALHSVGVLSRLLESANPFERDLGTAARYAIERYERAKRRRGALDFDDLERGADRALEIARVRESFQSRFDLVLVDEFQDTNPIQARIILRLVKPDASNLVVVGDPKQSIYRFRDADVSVFEEFCAKLPERRSLTRNFRSRPGIIEYVNTVCGELFPSSSLSFEPLVPQREAAGEAVVRLDVEGPAELARWIRAETARGVPLHEMALLLRKIRGNERWLRALVSAGIPIAVGSGGLFWEDPRVRELVELVRWWDNPGNSLSGAVFLRAPWVGVPDREIDEWVKRDPTLWAPFFESGHPMARALAPLRDRPIRPGELILAALIDEATEAELGSAALGLWHRTEDMSSRGLDFREIASELGRATREERRERDVPPPLNQGQLPVLTLHGSKGLEFNHVILVDLGKKPKAQDMPLLFWDRLEGARLGGRTVDGDRDRKDPVESTWRERERAQQLAESKRVFYVALTRARERLVLVCPALDEKAAAKIDPGKAFLEDYWRAWIECASAKPVRLELPEPSYPSRAAAVPEKPRPLEGRFTAQKRMLRPRHSVTEWNLLSRCARAYEWTYIRPRLVADGLPEIGLYTGARVEQVGETLVTQRELGTRVHACLETGDYDGLRALEKEVGQERFQAERVVSWALSSPWMKPSAPGRSVWTELAFELPFGRDTLVGALDRLVEEAGRYMIIDFKVTAQVKAVDALVEAYQSQIDLYAAAVRRLDPSARAVEAMLVHIASQRVQVIPIAPREGNEARLAREAAEIVVGQAGKATPGALCGVCEFRRVCDAAVQPAR
jgi:ATP-dependent exoDNAse (exonuclease V) beta subunit